MKLTALALGALLAVAAHGSTLYDTMGPGYSYALSGSTIGGPTGIQVADLVEVTTGGPLTQIILSMAHTSGQNLYQLDFVIPEVDGPTGASFFSQTFSLTGNLTTLDLQSGPTLTAGQQFWLLISAAGEATQGAWWTNGTGARGFIAWRENSAPTFTAAGTTWNMNGDSYLNGIQLNSGTTPDPVAAPEPSTALLAAPALLVLGLLRRKRR